MNCSEVIVTCRRQLWLACLLGVAVCDPLQQDRESSAGNLLTSGLTSLPGLHTEGGPYDRKEPCHVWQACTPYACSTGRCTHARNVVSRTYMAFTLLETTLTSSGIGTLYDLPMPDSCCKSVGRVLEWSRGNALRRMAASWHGASLGETTANSTMARARPASCLHQAQSEDLCQLPHRLDASKQCTCHALCSLLEELTKQAGPVPRCEPPASLPGTAQPWHPCAQRQQCCSATLHPAEKSHKHSLPQKGVRHPTPSTSFNLSAHKLALMHPFP